MPNEDDYKTWQERYESLNQEGWENHDLDDDDPDKWNTKQERDHAENMREAAEQERIGREEARDDWGEDGNDGHDERIERVKANELLAANKRDHLDGTYEYATSMQDGDDDLHRELEEENNRRWQGYQMEEEGQEREDDDEREEDEDSDENSDMDIDEDDDY